MTPHRIDMCRQTREITRTEEMEVTDTAPVRGWEQREKPVRSVPRRLLPICFADTPGASQFEQPGTER